MINNYFEYELAKKWAIKFRRALEDEGDLPVDVDPILFEVAKVKAAKEGMREKLSEIEQEIAAYEQKEI